MNFMSRKWRLPSRLRLRPARSSQPTRPPRETATATTTRPLTVARSEGRLIERATIHMRVGCINVLCTPLYYGGRPTSGTSIVTPVGSATNPVRVCDAPALQEREAHADRVLLGLRL